MAMTLGEAVAHQADSSALNVLTYNGLTTGRGIVCLILFAADSGDEAVSSVAVNGESNMTLVGTPSRNASSGWSSQIAFLPAMSAGGNKTITVTIGGSAPNNSYVFLQELHDGSNGGIALDGAGNASGATANPTVNVTTGTANSAIFSVLEHGGSDPTPGANYTSLAATGWFNWEESAYDLDTLGAGTIAANWTVAAGEWTLAAAGFKAAASGASSRTPTVATQVLTGIAPRMDLGIRPPTLLRG